MKVLLPSVPFLSMQLMEKLAAACTTEVGKSFGSFTIAAADEFSYTDPETQETVEKQGIRFMAEADLKNGSMSTILPSAGSNCIRWEPFGATSITYFEARRRRRSTK